MSFHTGQTFVFGEQPSATKWQYVWDNDYALADGTGIEDDAIIARHLANSIINASHIDWSTSGEIWWEELGRASLLSSADTLGITSFTARKFLRILIVLVNSGSISPSLRFNNDSGNNYAYTYEFNGAGSATGTSQSSIGIGQGNISASQWMEVGLFNDSSRPKLGNALTINNGGADAASTAPNAYDPKFKWNNTADQVTRVDVINGGTGDFAAGSFLVVLGHD